MYFEKENQIVSVNMKTGLAQFENGDDLKIARVQKLHSTIDKIAFMEHKGFKVKI